MAKYEIIHKITREMYLGEIEAEDIDEARELAIDLLPLSIEDYDTDDEIIANRVYTRDD
jgi:hypothetical protein